MPGPRIAAPVRREAVHGQDRGRSPGGLGPGDRRRDRGVERGIEAGDPRLLAGLVDPGVARHHGAVGEAHHQRRVGAAAVRIDDQAREMREDRRRAELRGQAPGHRRRADIVGDVPGELAVRQAEIDVRRNVVRGVVADDDEAAAGVAGSDLAGMRRRMWIPGGRFNLRTGHGAPRSSDLCGGADGACRGVAARADHLSRIVRSRQETGPPPAQKRAGTARSGQRGARPTP